MAASEELSALAARRIGRFWSKVDVRGPDECWPWMAYVDKQGYGRFGWTYKEVVRAHQALLRLHAIEVPSAHEADHLCGNKVCCNLRHIEVVLGVVNASRGSHARWDGRRRTHCGEGHLLSGRGSYVSKKGQRRCRICTLAEQRAAYAASGCPR